MLFKPNETKIRYCFNKVISRVDLTKNNPATHNRAHSLMNTKYCAIRQQKFIHYLIKYVYLECMEGSKACFLRGKRLIGISLSASNDIWTISFLMTHLLSIEKHECKIPVTTWVHPNNITVNLLDNSQLTNGIKL